MEPFSSFALITNNPDSDRSAVNFDGVSGFQVFAIKTEHLDLLFNHALSEYFAAIRAHAVPDTNGRSLFQPLASVPSIELKDLQHSEIVKERSGLGSIGTVHHGNRDITSVGRDANTLGCRSDRNLIDSPRRVCREIDEAHYIDAARGACTDVRNHRQIAGRSDVHSIRLKAGKEVTFGVRDVNAIDGQQEIRLSLAAFRETNAVRPSAANIT